MARTIGKKNIKFIQGIVREEIKSSGYEGLDERVIKRVPIEVFDTWESAWNEINRVIWDTRCENGSPWG